MSSNSLSRHETGAHVYCTCTLQVLEYEDEVCHLEAERTKLLKKLRVKALERGERAGAAGISVERLMALEELEADLHEDPDLSEEHVAGSRFRKATQRKLTPATVTSGITSVPPSVIDIHVLQQRDLAMQAELDSKAVALQVAEAAKRRTEREKSSILQDRERLEEQLLTTRRASLSSEASAALVQQGAALKAELAEARTQLKVVLSSVRSLAAEQAAATSRSGDNQDQTPRGCGSTASCSAAGGPDASPAILAAEALDRLLSKVTWRLEAVAVEERAIATMDTRVPPPVSVAQQQIAASAATLAAPAEAAASPGDPPSVTVQSARAKRLQQQRSPSVETCLADQSGAGASAPVEIPAELLDVGAGSVEETDHHDILAVCNAQLLEAKAMLAQQEAQLSKADREVHAYERSFRDLHEQQTLLYQAHVRETRSLSRQLSAAEVRASRAESQHAEDVVRIQSWQVMADALESTGGASSEEAVRKVAMMGRRLTSLRVREMALARQVTVQAVELTGLRTERASLEAEARSTVVESAAALARAEREKCSLENRVTEVLRSARDMAPKRELDVERASVLRYQNAYRVAAEQAARCAGSHHDKVGLEAEVSALRHKLDLTEAALSSSAASQQAARRALGEVAAATETGQRGDSQSLLARVHVLTITEAAATSRADAAERVLEDAMNGRRDLIKRLQASEMPVAEIREALRASEQALTSAQVRLAENVGSHNDVASLANEAQVARREVEDARDEARRARELESAATVQAVELAARQARYEEECTMLRAALAEAQTATDDATEAGKHTWHLLLARRSEGEAKRREAAACARQRHVQGALYHLQLSVEAHAGELHAALTAERNAELDQARMNAKLQQLQATTVTLPAMESLAAKVTSYAANLEEAQRQRATAEKERDALNTELLVAIARDEDQRALLGTMIRGAEHGEYATLLHKASSAAAAGKGAGTTDVAAAPVQTGPATGVVTLMGVSQEKTHLKVSELRLKRRVAALELANLQALEAGSEANSAREVLEEEVVRARETIELEGRQSQAREAEMLHTISVLRQKLQAVAPTLPSTASLRTGEAVEAGHDAVPLASGLHEITGADMMSRASPHALAAVETAAELSEVGRQLLLSENSVQSLAAEVLHCTYQPPALRPPTAILGLATHGHRRYPPSAPSSRFHATRWQQASRRSREKTPC